MSISALSDNAVKEYQAKLGARFFECCHLKDGKWWGDIACLLGRKLPHELPPITTPSLLSKAVSFSKSIMSRAVHGRVELEIFQQRSNQCHGDGTTAPCPARAYSGSSGKGHHYCSECGCGEDKKISQTGSTTESPILIPAGADYDSAPYLKLMYPSVDCPRRRPGFSNEEVSPFITSDASRLACRKNRQRMA